MNKQPNIIWNKGTNRIETIDLIGVTLLLSLVTFFGIVLIRFGCMGS